MLDYFEIAKAVVERKAVAAREGRTASVTELTDAGLVELERQLDNQIAPIERAVERVESRHA